MRAHLLATAVTFLLASACSDNPSSLADEGLALARSGKIDGAIALFERSLEEDERNAKARYNLGIALLETRNPTDAAAHFRTFVRYRPTDSTGHFSLARAELAAGRMEPALLALREAVLNGFSDPGALAAAGFDALANDIRYVQLEAVVAQRAGPRASPETTAEFPGRTGDGYGSERLGQPVALPGTNINAPNCPLGSDATACLAY